jgi:YesN/AraC family two-component response regulator
MMQAGDLAFIGWGTEHYVSYLQKKRPYSLLWFVLQGWGRISMHRSIYTRSGVFQVRDQQQIKVPIEVYRSFNQLALKGQSETGSWDRLRKDIIGLFTVFSGQKTEKYLPVANKWQQQVLHKVTEYLMENCNQDLSVSQVAEQFSFNRDYLNTLFSRAYGEGIMHFINSERLRGAANNLQITTLNVNQIAMERGFKDIYYFRRIFKKYFGLTPTEYRKNFC